MMMMMMMMMMQICVAHRRSIQLCTVCEDRVIALKDISVVESPLTLVTFIFYCHTVRKYNSSVSLLWYFEVVYTHSLPYFHVYHENGGNNCQ